ncbi:DUF3540 domain-containing protein [Burkholderia alba]|uniref:DUF3540 domain-containing protein n=1 Tax=Burkholderia alba TaxID=2683677 RepID=UPI002B05BF26|nr:DUF3540 domain-containing protein [Burkholderia alba]
MTPRHSPPPRHASPPPDSASAPPRAADPSLHTARVAGRVGEWLLFDDPMVRARRAAGCLLAPDVGDFVLIWRSPVTPSMSGDAGFDDAGSAHAYVLTVLARGGAPLATLALPGGVALEAGVDGLRIDASRIALAARDRIDADAPRIDLSAGRARVSAARLDIRAESVDGRARDARLVAQRFTGVFDRAWHLLGHCFRRVRGVDDTRAGRIRWQVDERAHLHARDVTLLADRQVGIDGARIDLG